MDNKYEYYNRRFHLNLERGERNHISNRAIDMNLSPDIDDNPRNGLTQRISNIKIDNV